MIEVSPQDREEVLRWASRITSQKTDPSAVIINAGPLLAWLEDAPDRPDQRLRLAALGRVSTNAMARSEDDADDVEAFLRRQGLASVGDDPEAFLAKAKTYYAFLTSGGRS